MPEIIWSDFIDAHPAGHVVAGLVRSDSRKGIAPARLQELQRLMSRLIDKLPPRGDFAVTVNWHQGEPEILCAFERMPDARYLADSVQAGRTGRYPGWKSQALFVLDDKAAAMIREAMAS